MNTLNWKRSMSKNGWLACTIAPIFFLTSCALGPISSEYDLKKAEAAEMEWSELGNGRIVIYNGADILHRIDNTARLNIWVDNKALGQTRAREFAIINLDDGKYEFKIVHLDIGRMVSKHPVEINAKTKVIRIEPTFFSNKLTITNMLPKKFDKYEYMENR